MYPLDIIQEQERRIQSLEKELNRAPAGTRSGPGVFLQVKAQADAESISAELNFGIVRPLKEEDAEFEGIWDFHQNLLVTDPPDRSRSTSCTIPMSSSAARTRRRRWTRTLSNTCSRRWRIPDR